jgi:ketosteroid isomerase-like protein
MKPLWLTVFACICLLFAAGCVPAATPAPPPPTPLPPPTPVPPTPAPDLTAPVKAWVEAINKGDMDAALALFTDDATQVGMFTAAGREQLRGVFDYLVGQGAQFGAPICQPRSDGVTCSFTVFNDCFAASGATDPLPMTGQYVIQPDGKISQARMDAQGNKAWVDWGDWYANFKAWASAEDWAKSVAHTKAGGATAIKLCQDYAESLKAPADPAATVKAWVAAINKGDVDAALAPFAADVKYMGVFTATGKTELRGLFEWMVSLGVKNAAPDCQAQNDKLVCTFTGVDPCVAAFGAADGLPSTGTYTIQPDGKIGEARVEYAGGRWDDYWPWVDAMIAWASETRAEELTKYAEAPMTKQTAPILIKLCQEYADSLQAPPTPAADLVAPVKAWADALNKGDVDAALAPMADSVWWTGSHEGNAAGKEQLRPLFDYLVHSGTKHQITECRQQTDRVTCTVSIIDGCIAAFGAPDGLPAELEFKFGPDGKIRESAMTAGDPRWKDYSNFTGARIAWARVNRAEEFAKVENSEDPREYAAIHVKLCQEYAESLK